MSDSTSTPTAARATTEVWLFLPQMRLSLPAIVERAQAAEAAGFGGIAFMDHLAPPKAEQHDMHDSFITATWVAAHTTRLGVGHLVLCDSFRHPAMLARQAVSLDHASGGRFELGIGWGSVPDEFDTWGIGDRTPRSRVDRLAETLDVLGLMWSGEPVTFDGTYHHIVDGCAKPTPLDRIPILIGGVGPKTLALVAKHADWWNVPVNRLDTIEALRPATGNAKVSVQTMVSFAPPGSDADAIHDAARRRFRHSADSGAMVLGGVDEVVAGFEAYAARGVKRIYAWFCDFAQPATLSAFAPVIAAVS